jgi:hypothetical protein
VLDLLSSDSIRVTFRAAARGKTFDTLRVIYHAAGTTGCIKVPVTGISNSTPVLHSAIPSQTAFMGRMFTFHIPDSTFVDGDAGDTLTYQAAGMPSWLSFNPLTLTFQGMPASNTVGIPLPIGIVVRDMLQASTSTSFVLMTQEATGVDEDQLLPEKVELFQNYPNPFNPTTIIRYQVPVTGDVQLVVYDILGRAVADLLNERKSAGSYAVTFDGRGLASGVYIYRLRAGDVVRTRTLLLLR